jgi:hypothetical protein
MNPMRRALLYLLSAIGLVSAGGAILAGPKRLVRSSLLELERMTSTVRTIPVAEPSDVFLARNGTPQENVAKVVEMMGGIGRFIGIHDIVILKPNAQWWNQGRTNLAAMKGFIDLVLEIPGFKGEVIIAENQHFMDESLPEAERDNVRGWTHLGEINGDIDGVNHNLNSLVALYQDKGIKNVTKYHWRDGGRKADVWGNGQNGGIVTGPAEGDGYVWTDDDYLFEGLWGMRKWRVKMTYPIFTSAYSGITIDFKNGAYLREGKSSGRYTENKPIRFINFSVLNDHGDDTGTTAAIKNYMGVTDLSCGWWGLQPEGYANVHECGSGYYPHAKAGPLGHFMRNIRVADLNIVTAEWVGWGSRVDVAKAAQMRTILAGTDPVALDYYGAKHLVYPLSRNSSLHDPDNPDSPIAKFLVLAQKSWGQGALKETDISVHEYDLVQG